MGLRIITGVIDVRGHTAPGSVEITFNPLAVVATSHGDVIGLKAYGDDGYFADKPFILMSVNNLSIEDMIDVSNIHNTIYNVISDNHTEPENIFQRVIYHRATLTWDYRRTSGDWTQGRVDKISFSIIGDAVPLEETPLQPLPPGSFGFYMKRNDLYIIVEEYQTLPNRKMAITNRLTSKEEIDLTIDSFVKNMEEIREKAKKELDRITAKKQGKKRKI